MAQSYPFLPPWDNRSKFNEESMGGNGVSTKYNQWFQQLSVAINKSLQFVTPPATLTSAGTPGQAAFDATGFFLCIAPNVWKKAAWL